ncbi:Hypothetical protein A7982_08674 [Minicystis rosea]|nr:Hypothetical protein A7982_08674 [Minicystis rosea]
MVREQHVEDVAKSVSRACGLGSARPLAFVRAWMWQRSLERYAARPLT